MKNVTVKHLVDDPKSKCECGECMYMRGFVGALARVRKNGTPDLFIRSLPPIDPSEFESELARWTKKHGTVAPSRPRTREKRS